MLVKIPKAFYDDHSDRALEAPPVVKTTKRHYVIETGHPDFPELCNDTYYYCLVWNRGHGQYENTDRNPALWLRKALMKQGAWPTTEKSERKLLAGKRWL